MLVNIKRFLLLEADKVPAFFRWRYSGRGDAFFAKRNPALAGGLRREAASTSNY